MPKTDLSTTRAPDWRDELERRIEALEDADEVQRKWQHMPRSSPHCGCGVQQGRYSSVLVNALKRKIG